MRCCLIFVVFVKKKKELSEVFIVDEIDFEGEMVVEDIVMEDMVMEDGVLIVFDVLLIDFDEEYEEEVFEEVVDEEVEVLFQFFVVKCFVFEEDDILD